MNLAWMEDGACVGVDTERFFPANGDHAGRARAVEVCAGCPVRVECLTWAIENGIEHGVFGGTSANQRINA